MPKIVDKEKMAQSIMTAALNAFAQYGFHKTTIDKIVKKAGIAKGTFYLYFDSKEMLSQRIMHTHFDQFNKNLTREGQIDSLEVLLKKIEQGLMISKEQQLYIPIFFEAFGPSFASKKFTQEVSCFFDKVGEFYAYHLQALIVKNRVNSDIDPIALGRVLVSMLDGIILHRSIFKVSDENYESMVKEVLNLFRRGLV